MRKVATARPYYPFAAGILRHLRVWGLGLNAGTVGLVVAPGIAEIAIRTTVGQRRASEPTSRSDV